MKDIMLIAKNNLAKRKYNTEKARELIYDILNELSMLIDDKDSVSVKSIIFTMSAFFEDKNSSYIYYIATHKGLVEIISEDWDGVEEIVSHEDITYINFAELVKALEDFVEKLSKLTTYEKEKDKLEEFLSILEKI